MRSIQHLTKDVDTLIEQLKMSPDKEAQILAGYVPLLINILKKKIYLVQVDDLQDAILDALQAIRIYNPNKGKLVSIIYSYVVTGILSRQRYNCADKRDERKTKFIGILRVDKKPVVKNIKKQVELDDMSELISQEHNWPDLDDESNNKRLLIAISRLPEQYKKAIQYRYYDKMTNDEVGRRLSVSGEGGRWICLRAINELRFQFENIKV